MKPRTYSGSAVTVNLSAHWPQELRFPMLGSVDWADIFLLEFARIVGMGAP